MARSAPIASPAAPAHRPGRLRRALLLVLPIATLGLPSTAHANDVLDWNELMLDAIRMDTSSPVLAARNLAILDAALHDTLNSLEPTHTPWARIFTPPSPAHPNAAVAAAGHAIVTALYPGVRASANSLLASRLAQLPPDAARTNGLAFGDLVGRHILRLRDSDGSSTDVPYIPSAAPGQWRRTPPFFRPPTAPGWRHVAPFAIDSTEPFVASPPPPLSSEAYATSLLEVQAYGAANSVVRTPEQAVIARFWSDFSYTVTPPGHWIEIACDIARRQSMTPRDSARMLALLALSVADAGIVCWEAKYRYNLWRPVTAIQRANEDGNDATTADPGWSSLLVSPPFPAYPSGHSTFSQAAAETLVAFFGTDAVRIEATSDSIPGSVRTYESLRACAAEIGMSRIYGGIHFSFDNTAGKRSGARVAAYITANWLLPLDTPAHAQTFLRDNGDLHLRLHGPYHRGLRLDSSPDLVHWTPVATTDPAPGGALVVIPASAAGCHFYRVVDIDPITGN